VLAFATVRHDEVIVGNRFISARRWSANSNVVTSG